MSSTTPELLIPYAFNANEDPGTEPFDRHRLIADRGIPKHFSTDIAATAALTYGYSGGIVVTGAAPPLLASRACGPFGPLPGLFAGGGCPQPSDCG